MTLDEAREEVVRLLGTTAQVVEYKHARGGVGFLISRQRGGHTEVLVYSSTLTDAMKRLRANRCEAKQQTKELRKRLGKEK